MTFDQMHSEIENMMELHRLEFQSLRLHGELLAKIVPAMDTMKASALRHDKEIAETRLLLHEAGEKLDALIKVVDGMIGGHRG